VLANTQLEVVLEKQDVVQIITMGTQGPAGQSLPIGGTVGQVLKKKSATNFDYDWSPIQDIATYTLATGA
jgi:hypothetical protein